MAQQSNSRVGRSYLLVVTFTMLILPLLSILIESRAGKEQLSLLALLTKWFVFWGVGIRLLTSGISQISNPSFTAQSIFHIRDTESFKIVRELGFANFCLGAVGIASLFMTGWRLPAAFSGGLFFGIAGVNHIIKKPESPNEVVALVSDIFIFIVLLAVFLLNFR